MSNKIEVIKKLLGKEYLELKKSIESYEKNNSSSSSEKVLLLEHQIKKIENVKIKMYKENHKRPHIHLDIGGEKHTASICIETSEILAGSVEKKYLTIVNEWLNKNRENLIVVWDSLQEKGTLDLSRLN